MLLISPVMHIPQINPIGPKPLKPLLVALMGLCCGALFLVNGPPASAQAAGGTSLGLEEAHRFQVLRELDGEAVLDTLTGLIWEQSPSTTRTAWYRAKSDCGVKAVGGRRGWRLPSFFELMTLVEPTLSNRTGTIRLPAGHPFSRLSGGVFWSSDTPTDDPVRAYVVDFVAGDVATKLKQNRASLWCVKGVPPRPMRMAPIGQVTAWSPQSTSPATWWPQRLSLR